jgi:hypothetical protein
LPARFLSASLPAPRCGQAPGGRVGKARQAGGNGHE